MKLVTIKNSQYTNTLWLTQFGLSLLTLIAVFLAAVNVVWFLLSAPVLLLVLYTNHLTLSQQSQLRFAMRSNGQLVVNNKITLTLSADSNAYSGSDDQMAVEVKSFWYLPGILMLKLSIKYLTKPVYITVFRSILGRDDFSHLLVGLTQFNDPLKINHEH